MLDFSVRYPTSVGRGEANNDREAVEVQNANR